MSSQTKRESLSKNDEVIVSYKPTSTMPHPKKRRGWVVEVLRAGARIRFDGEKGEPLFPFSQIEIAPIERKKEPPKADPAFTHEKRPDPIVEHKRQPLAAVPAPTSDIESQIGALRQMALDLIEPIRRRIDEIDTTCAVLQDERTHIDREIDELTKERGKMKAELSKFAQFETVRGAQAPGVPRR
jgi:hypothetical protein